MSKTKIILFFDGTLATPQTHTNVYKLFVGMKADLAFSMVHNVANDSCNLKDHHNCVKVFPSNVIFDNNIDIINKTIKIYIAGVDTENNQNHMEKNFREATGLDTAKITEHVILHTLQIMGFNFIYENEVMINEKMNIHNIIASKKYFLAKSFDISVVGFSRGSASATLFVNSMSEMAVNETIFGKVKINIATMMLFDRIVSVHLKELDPVLYEHIYDKNFSNIPQDANVMHIVCSHDTRNHLKDMTNSDTQTLDPILLPLPHKQNQLEFWMPGSHCDIGGWEKIHHHNKIETYYPQALHSCRLATYFLINNGFTFTDTFIKYTLSEPMSIDAEHKYIPPVIHNKISEVPSKSLQILLCKFGGIKTRHPIIEKPIIHENIFLRLKSRFKGWDSDTFIPNSKIPNFTTIPLSINQYHNIEDNLIEKTLLDDYNINFLCNNLDENYTSPNIVKVINHSGNIWDYTCNFNELTSIDDYLIAKNKAITYKLYNPLFDFSAAHQIMLNQISDSSDSGSIIIQQKSRWFCCF